MLTLNRYNDIGTVTDDFSYSYYSGTNKLQKVSGTKDQYTYDLNGNTISDGLNTNSNIKYDYRNLITEIYHVNTNPESINATYATRYFYDEAGNRIRKLTFYNTQTNPGDVLDWNNLNNPGNGWILNNNEFYIRGVDGKELAIYKDSVIQQWNVYGLDNVGKLVGNKKYYYMKDHLGSVRAVLDEAGEVVSAQDYDAWGYLLENREYESAKSVYKFTSKERDKETAYDYFGARYYDARIGRWGQVEPLLDKYPSLTPYNYSKNNPLIIIDPNGKDPLRKYLGSYNEVLNIIEKNIGKSYWEISKVFEQSSIRYIYTEKSGFIDLKHFFAAAHISKTISFNDALNLGEVKEFQQGTWGNESTDNPEDRPSNLAGARFGEEFKYTENVYDNFKEYIEQQTPLDPSDPQIAPDKIYIPFDEHDKPLPVRKSYFPYRGESPNFNRRNILE